MKIKIVRDDESAIIEGDFLYLEGGFNNGKPSFHIQMKDKQGDIEIHFESEDKEEFDDFVKNIGKTILPANFTKEGVVGMIDNCINEYVTSKFLGDYASEGVYYYLEGLGKDIYKGNVQDILEDISAQWEMYGCKEHKWEFPKEWLNEWKKKLM